ncbi:AroM family protein [Microbacterium paraoxydans]|uniref:AroM family protein n=1 Tax=Microbacterium paraoxydans TaxID=199592 RepID=UPI0004685C94|nr:AroM family protein [Microbacterium paraoxydans]
MPQIGVITIGQAPRDDMTRAFAPHFGGTGVEVVQRGALDGFTAEEISERFAPRVGSATYVSKLLTGESVEIAKNSIIERMQAHVDELAPTCDAIVIVCTGDFPMLTSGTPMFFPDRLLVDTVRERGVPGKLGLIVPLPDQEEVMAEKWEQLGAPIAFAHASPYAASDIEGAARALVAEGAGVIVLDCIGYTKQHAERAAQAVAASSDVDVIVPQDLVPEVVAGRLGLTEQE